MTLKQFLTLDNFQLAIARMQTFSRNENRIYYRAILQAYAFYSEEVAAYLLNAFKQNTYSPSDSYHLYRPKKNGLIRPLTLLHPMDLVVYNALNNVIINAFNKNRSKLHTTFSSISKTHIFNNKFKSSGCNNAKFAQPPWMTEWRAYHYAYFKTYAMGYNYVVKFDIASFFDTISHKVLAALLQILKVSQDIIDILLQCLEKWSVSCPLKGVSLPMGIPQVPLPSSILAEILCTYIDGKCCESCKSIDYQYLRYVDDIHIFTKSEKEGYEIITKLDVIIRSLGLIPQSQKIDCTYFSKEEIEAKKKHVSMHLDKFNVGYTTQNQIDIDRHNELRSIFANCMNPESPDYQNKTLINFCLFRMREDEAVKKMIFDNPKILQYYLQAVLFYLERHYAKNTEVCALMLNWFYNEHSTYNQIEMLPYLVDNGGITEEKIKAFENLNYDWHYNYNRVGLKFSSAENISEITQKATDPNQNPLVRLRAMATNLQYLQSDKQKEKWLSSFSDSEPSIALGALHLQFCSEGASHQNFQFPALAAENKWITEIHGVNSVGFMKQKMKKEYNIENVDSFFCIENWQSPEQYYITARKFELFYRTQNSQATESTTFLKQFLEHLVKQLNASLALQNTKKNKQNLELRQLYPNNALIWEALDYLENIHNSEPVPIPKAVSPEDDIWGGYDHTIMHLLANPSIKPRSIYKKYADFWAKFPFKQMITQVIELNQILNTQPVSKKEKKHPSGCYRFNNILNIILCHYLPFNSICNS